VIFGRELAGLTSVPSGRLILGYNDTLTFFVALLLGIRHATDPDHLTAVSTVVLSRGNEGARRAGVLGLAWGIGHATTLLAFGIPLLLFARELPAVVLQGAEVAIGLIIVLLAARLLLRWRRGHYHTHPHVHGGRLHTHPHVHEGAHPAHTMGHTHDHGERLGRSPVAAFGIGMVHGLGGSAGAGILVVGAASSRVPGLAALVLFAGGTAASMALVSAAFGYALARPPVASRVSSFVPLLAVVSLIFGAWYAFSAMRGPTLGL
jgi:ABC-type nickel/cobalt efflux system permease component RcnA